MSKKDQDKANSPGLFEKVASLKAFVISALGLIGVALGAAVVLIQSQDLSIIVNPLVIPEDLQKQGHDSNALAQQLAADLIKIQRTVEGRAKTDRLAARFISLDGATDRKVPIVEGHNLLDIKLSDEVPSLRKVARALKQLRGEPDLTIDVAIIGTTGRYKANASVIGGWVGERKNVETSFTADIAALVHEAAIESMWLIEPYILTSYQRFIDDDACRQTRTCSYERTLQLLDRLDREDPMGQAVPDGIQRRCWVLLARSSVVMRLGRFDEVVALASMAVQLDKQFGPGYFNWVNALLGAERYPEAAHVAKQWVDVAPKDAEAYEYLGTALERVGRPDEAIAAFKQSLSIESKPVVNVLWGNLLTNQKRYVEAGEKYASAAAEQRRLKQTFEEATTSFQWGQMLLRSGDARGAADKFLYTIALDTMFPRAEEMLGRALVSDGQYREAIPHFGKAESRQQMSAAGYRAWGTAFEKLGQRKDGATKYAKAKELERRTAR